MGRWAKLRQKWNFWILNTPLRIKLIGIIVFSLLCLVGTSIMGIQKLRSRYNELLYNTYQLVLNVSATTFSDMIDNTTEYIKTISTDDTIQKYLASIKDEQYLSMLTVQNLEKKMQMYINDEMNQLLYGISITTDKAIIYNGSYTYDNGYDASLGTKFSVDELQAVVERAPLEKTLWLTDYVNSYGLVVVQNIRRISPMRLDSLGVLVGCINLQPVIQECASQIQQEKCYFSLVDKEGNAFYLYNNLGEELDFSEQLVENYTVLKQKDNSYFVIRGSLKANGWGYVYAIPYDTIELAVRKSTLQIIWVMCLCSIAAIGVAVLMIRQILRDFNKLVDMIVDVGDDPFKGTELPMEDTKRRDEIGVIMQEFEKMSNKIDRLIQDNYESRLSIQEARLQALEMQINPHFLYNTLESVRCCAKLGQNENVCCIVEALGNIMHLIMSDYNNELHLEQEINLINDYIVIQKLRFDQRLDFSEEVEDCCYHAILPKLTILPLVENAVVHGVENCPDTCYIKLKIWHEEGNVRIQIKNTGTVFAEDFFSKLKNNEIKPTKHGIGLLNVDSRLKLFFKKDYGIEFYNEDKWAVADMTIPYWKAQNMDEERV